VLDLACGFGFYTRLLKQHGAAEVIGIDISPEMVRLGREQERTEPLGVTYEIHDATSLLRWDLRSRHRHLSAQLRDKPGPAARDVPECL